MAKHSARESQDAMFVLYTTYVILPASKKLSVLDTEFLV